MEFNYNGSTIYCSIRFQLYVVFLGKTVCGPLTSHPENGKYYKQHKLCNQAGKSTQVCQTNRTPNDYSRTPLFRSYAGHKKKFEMAGSDITELAPSDSQTKGNQLDFQTAGISNWYYSRQFVRVDCTPTTSFGIVKREWWLQKCNVYLEAFLPPPSKEPVQSRRSSSWWEMTLCHNGCHLGRVDSAEKIGTSEIWRGRRGRGRLENAVLPDSSHLYLTMRALLEYDYVIWSNCIERECELIKKSTTQCHDKKLSRLLVGRRHSQLGTDPGFLLRIGRFHPVETGPKIRHDPSRVHHRSIPKHAGALSLGSLGRFLPRAPLEL